jgi:hypothetical protein
LKLLIVQHAKRLSPYAFSHELFDKSQLAEKLISIDDKNDVSESVRLLVNANILSNIGDGTYTLHLKVEQEYLAAKLHKLL